MEIYPIEPRPREKFPSTIDVKNTIKLGHNECCNCYCCKPANFPAYKYIQPEVPKSFQPIKTYFKSDIPLDDKTTYKTSFWPNRCTSTKPILQKDNLGVSEGAFEDETTQKMSYMGNWSVEPQKKILPCSRSLFGRGPMECNTTQNTSFMWQFPSKTEPIKYDGNLRTSRCSLDDNTTYKMSYYSSTPCLEKVKSFAPIKRYEKSDKPVDETTTYRLSFFKNDPVSQPEKHPWQQKPKYEEPCTPVENSTTYNLSFWPQKAEAVQPVVQKSEENLLNKTCRNYNDTTYGMSYWGGPDGDKRHLKLPTNNEIFEKCPLLLDTVNKMSYVGNWRPKPEKPIKPCARELTGRGPIEDSTTQKRDFTWKYSDLESGYKPSENLEIPKAPLESYTTNRLSYFANSNETLMPTKSFAPIKKYERVDVPMDTDTTMQLSYQPVPEPKPIEKPWAMQKSYEPPTTNVDENTTYSLSYIPPGKLVPS